MSRLSQETAMTLDYVYISYKIVHLYYTMEREVDSELMEHQCCNLGSVHPNHTMSSAQVFFFLQLATYMVSGLQQCFNV